MNRPMTDFRVAIIVSALFVIGLACVRVWP